MGDGDAGGESGERAAERARSVTLYHQQVGRGPDMPGESSDDRLDMRVRILASRAAKFDLPKLAKPMLGGIEFRVLTGQNQCRSEGARRQCMRDGCELDGFRSRANDERDVSGLQPSP